jgi:hypothetical protein
MQADRLRTNRDLYLFIASLRDQAGGASRNLEEYLRALWHLGSGHRATEQLSLESFAQLLAASFAVEVPAFDPAWRSLADARAGFLRWTILLQIVDLREMSEAGMLADQFRYLGIDAPRGSWWYNFDPLTYLECAAAGSFGGWQEGDDTGRRAVSGHIAAFDQDGHIVSVDPRKLDPVCEIPHVGWDAFADFLNLGQSYE